jgi:hypothetical protein
MESKKQSSISKRHFIDKLLFSLGYIFSYLVFTAVLFFVLKYTGRQKPAYVVAAITFSISLAGAMLRRWLR